MRASGQLVVLFAGLLLWSSLGCVSRIAGEAVGAVAGASGKYIEIQTLSRSALRRYSSLSIEPLNSQAGLYVPAGFAPHFSLCLRAKLQEKKLFLDSPGKKLVLKGEIVHYEEDRWVDQAIGPLQEAIARVTLSDAETGVVLGSANIIGRAKSTSAGGADRLADGLAKGVIKWLEQ